MAATATVQLHILIVGAGIAGLTAAVALRKAGHAVTVYEKSGFLRELGAGMICTTNGTKVLEYIDYPFEKSGAVPLKKHRFCNGTTAQVHHEIDAELIAARFGAPMLCIYRPDHHATLLAMATGESYPNTPVEIHLNSPVVGVDPSTATITLSSGTTARGDLVLVADGIHSRLRALLFPDLPPITNSGACLRFRVPTAALTDEAELAALLDEKRHTADFYDAGGYRLVWYEVRGDEIQNFVFYGPDLGDAVVDGAPDVEKAREMLMKASAAFDPRLRRVLEKAESLTPYPLLDFPPPPTFHVARALLLGDAAHTFHPHSAQGITQATEDAGVLATLLEDLPTAEELPARLALYEKVRGNRCRALHVLARTPVGRESEAMQVGGMREWLEGTVVNGPVGRGVFVYGADPIKAARGALEGRKML